MTGMQKNKTYEGRACPHCGLSERYLSTGGCAACGSPEVCRRLLRERTEMKESNPNPKDQIGCTKAPLSKVSQIANAYESLAMAEGAIKYGSFNFRVVGVRASIYLDAALRHIYKWENGEECDPKTKVPHLGSARACLGILLEAQHLGKLTDDRPPSDPNFSDTLDSLTDVVQNLKEVFASSNPRHYTIADTVSLDDAAT